jgi:hypothetical protein
MVRRWAVEFMPLRFMKLRKSSTDLLFSPVISFSVSKAKACQDQARA